MVFPDLSAPQLKAHQVVDYKRPPIASVADRFLALILDFFIFSPVISLLIAGLVRQTKTFFLINPTSQEGAIAAGLVGVMAVFLTMLLQAVFLYFWQATAGQVFLQLKVIAYPHHQERLTFNQCLIRSFMWCAGFLLLGLPYLEIVSHPLRRAFHERASDTLVITLKRNPDDGPLPLESRFISSWLRMSFLFIILFGSLGFIKTYHALIGGSYRESASDSSLLCKEITEPALTGVKRLDAALSLFLLNEISAECLEKEANASLWGDPVNPQGLAYLAKFLIVDSAVEQKKYFAKVCAESHSSACAMARYMRGNGKRSDLEYADKELWTTRLLWSEEKYSQKDYEGSLKIIKDLQGKAVLKAALEKRYVRSIWALNEIEHMQDKNKGRRPASVSNKWIDLFKEKYEVP